MANIPKARDGASSEEEEEIIDEEEIQDDEELDDTTDEDLDGDEGDDDADEDDDEDLSPEELKAKLKKAKQIAKNQKIRAEKAESKLKKGGDQKKKKVVKTSSTQPNALSNSDLITIVKNNIDEDDIPEVQKYAKMEGISFKEALSTSFIKTLLANKAEERETASAVHTGSSRKTTGKKSASQVLDDASKGILPDDTKALAEARLAKRRGDREHRTRR